jgi:hypothetical protein
MLTLPSTLGLFDPNIGETARLLHEHGALRTATAQTRTPSSAAPAWDMGFDVVHLNSAQDVLDAARWRRPRCRPGLREGAPGVVPSRTFGGALSHRSSFDTSG